MKQQDIDRLREICEREGFVLETTGENFIHNRPLFTISMIDPWDGVEFAECVEWDGLFFISGKIYPVKKQEIDSLILINRFGERELMNILERFKPSTEAAYVNQLKSEAFELFGEIKDGDEFDRTSINPNWGIGEVKHSQDVFYYNKRTDTFYFGRTGIYQQGKWAKKIQRVKVICVGSTLHATQMDNCQEIDIRLESSKSINKSKQEIGEYLAKCLETKLNELNEK
jgi:hypothetical protein